MVFLFNLMKGHYDINISDKLLISKGSNVDYKLRKMTLLTLLVCIVELIVLNIVILSALSINGIAYPMM